jgi:RNA polymerase sigma-70 factor, ECF subfamily
VSTGVTAPVDLIEKVARKDRQAFSQLYDRFAPLVYSLALRMLKAPADAEDLLQEVFVQLWRQAGQYRRDRGTPEAWIINITRSRAIDRLRSARRMDKSFVLTADPPAAETADAVESAAAESELRVIMNSALASLPESQRTVLELAYFDGFTQSEIAARLAEPLGTVKTRMRSGIQRLRSLLGTGAS